MNFRVSAKAIIIQDDRLLAIQSLYQKLISFYRF